MPGCEILIYVLVVLVAWNFTLNRHHNFQIYRSLDGDRHSEYWKDVRTVIDDELRKLRDDRGRLGTSIHGSVQQDVDKIFKVWIDFY